MNKDLTIGKPSKVLLLYALPLFGSIIFQQLYTVADSFVAGHFIGSEALAAVGNSYEITLLYISVAFGCNIGTSVVVARYFGIKDNVSVRTAASTAFISCFIIGIILVIIGIFAAKPLLNVIKTPDEIMNASALYLYIYLGGYIFLLIYNISTGIFAALGDSVTPFIFLVVSSVTNIAMDIIFVVNFKMGVAGVAWATFICQGLSGITAFIVVVIRLKKLSVQKKPKMFDMQIFKQLSKVTIPSVLQQGFVSVGNIIIQGFINSFGTAAIAGYAAAVKFNNLSVTSLASLGNGMSNFASQNFGAEKPERIKKGFWAGIVMGICLSAVFIILYSTLAETFSKWFIYDGNANAISVSVAFMTTVAPFYFIIPIKIIADGVLRGTNKMFAFMLTTFVDLILRVVLSAIFAKTIGINGIWYSWPVGWIIGASVSIGIYIALKNKNFSVKMKENMVK